MPLLKQFKTPENSDISLWLLNEDFENLKAQANFFNIDLRESFYKNEQQHKEYLASRIALKKNDTSFIVDEVDEKSAPVLKNSSTQISISHCKKMKNAEGCPGSPLFRCHTLRHDYRTTHSL